MNQQCKVCGEPAAGFHFGAFTCEGCKSFFGRSYNNLSSLSECKNNGECIINKKNRTSCKACRLRKCLLVGMSKSGSRYGRRSNWFKIHCLLQEQQEAKTSMNSYVGQKAQSAFSPSIHPFYSPNLLSRTPYTDDKATMMRFNEQFKKPETSSPSVSSPESLNSDNDSMVAITMDHNEPRPSPNLRKDYFSAFPGYHFMPGLLPPSSHFLLSSYQNALQEHSHHFMRQHSGQDLLKIASYPTSLPDERRNSEIEEEKQTLKRKSSSSSESANLPKVIKRSISPAIQESGESDIEVENDDVLTPPTSPKFLENNPIDLSNKSLHSVESLGGDRKMHDPFRKIHLRRSSHVIEKLTEKDDNHNDSIIATRRPSERHEEVHRSSFVESVALNAPLDLTSKA